MAGFASLVAVVSPESSTATALPLLRRERTSSFQGYACRYGQSDTGQRCGVYDVRRCEIVTSGERYAVAKRQLTTKELRQ
ncbi:MAG: hypothetical protein FJ147_19240 [Deltaproteobacteria bacterium]|nr:hypothetical protein [Deltaproteobacteria bacterium]